MELFKPTNDILTFYDNDGKEIGKLIKNNGKPFFLLINNGY